MIIKDCVKKSDRSMTYEGRIVTLEQKTSNDRENADKRHENVKDLLQRHKDTLDARVNMAVAYNDKIDDLRVEVSQLVASQQKFEDTIRLEVGSINKTACDSKTMSTILDKQLKNFESESRSMHTEKKDAI